MDENDAPRKPKILGDFRLLLGGPHVRTIEDVQSWADRNGGELAVRNALANGVFSYGADRVQKWLEIIEHQRVMQHQAESLEVDRRAAQAAERAARWAMWSAIVSAAVGLVSAAAYWLSRVPD